MRIRYHGHACFEFVNESGRSLLFDPYKPDALGGRFQLPPVEASPDWIAITHYHEDHCWLQPEWADTPVLDENLETPDIRVEAIPTYHDGESCGTRMGLSIALRIHFGGMDIVHLGDINEQLSSAALQALEKPAVLLLPVGGTYTFGPEEGLAIANLLKPTWIVPMHAADPRIDLPLEPLSSFFELWEGPVCDIENKAWETTLSQPAVQSTLLALHPRGFPQEEHGEGSVNLPGEIE